MKSGIIEELGQADLLLPSLIAEGLAANDRVKVRLSALQASARHARDPQGARFNLMDECRTAGVDPMPLEALVNCAILSSDERIMAPGLAILGKAIWDDMTSMLRPIEAADKTQGDQAGARLGAIQATTTLGSSDYLKDAEIAALATVGDVNDSLHRLIMDLHKSLNRLAAIHAEEDVAGAHAYGLLPQDRSAVEAFMRGVEKTRKLKFTHPGLATTATRAGGRLTIQNDIGETDAHVVVIAVDLEAVTVTYTDVHHARATFFTRLSRDFPVQWSGLERKSVKGLADDEAFYLVSGRYAASASKDRDAFLEALGASLVFLIDWNKARKVLRQWLPNASAIRILDWAARNRVGHRGFLELGGAELVASAVHHAAPARIGFGERLDGALGREAAVDFLKTVLRISAEALLQGSSLRLARDRIETALVAHLGRVDAEFFSIVIRQAGLARDIVERLGSLFADRRAGRPCDPATLAERARRIEEKADRIAVEARSEIVRVGADRGIERLVDQVEDAIDDLEQAAFAAALVPSEVPTALLDPLAELSAAALAGTEAVAVAAASAAEVPEGHRVDTEDALAAVGRLVEAEHRADAAERAVTATILTGEYTLKMSLSVLEVARALERSTDHLARFGHFLRDHVLADLAYK